MYYPTVAPGTKYPDGVSGIRRMHNEHRRLKGEFLKSDVAKEYFPIQFLTGEKNLDGTDGVDASQLDVQAVIVVPTHGADEKRMAVFDATKYLTRQLVGDFFATDVPNAMLYPPKA